MKQYTKKKSRFILYFLLITLLVVGCSKQSTKTIQESDLTVTFLDVGKADCIIVQTKDGSVIMIDTGYEDTVSVVQNYLMSKDIHKIDELIITHYDKDHVGGAADILNLYEVGTVYLPNYTGTGDEYQNMMSHILDKQMNVVQVAQDITIHHQELTCTIFASDILYDADKKNDNNVSLVISLLYGNDSYLLTGDIEKKGIKNFLDKVDITFDVLKVPHHGSTEGNIKKLLDSVSPKYAIITDGRERLADEDVLAILEESKINTYRLSVDGTITIYSDGKQNYRIDTQHD